MKYKYQKEIILKWQYSDDAIYPELYPIPRNKKDYELKYSCVRCKKFNYDENKEYLGYDFASVVAYNPKSGGRYCADCLNWLELNDIDFACGLEGFKN